MLQIDMSPTPPFSAKPALKAYLPMFHFRKCYRRYLAKRTEILPKKILCAFVSLCSLKNNFKFNFERSDQMIVNVSVIVKVNVNV